MSKTTIPLLVGTALACAVAMGAEAQKNLVTVDAAKVKCSASPDLWGIFFEDIDLSLDGGVYAELVRNRSFEDDDGKLPAALGYWQTRGSAKMEINVDQPVSPKNLHALRVEAAAGSGVANEGYFGMNVKPGVKYRLTLKVRGEAKRLTAALEGRNGRVVSSVEQFAADGSGWRDVEVTLKGEIADPEAKLVIRAPEGGCFYLDCVSLFPSDTYGKSGLFRKDLMEKLAALKPSFVRFPGGCWVEGDTMAKAYRWKKTIGSIWDRPTQWNIWGYWATHGVGYHEYLLICEELGAKPLFCINVGMSHREIVPLDKMDEFVQDALDCIEYANGPVTSRWGAERAKNGHPAPFNLEYLEIGNENGGREYEERYALIAKAVRAKYPNVKLVFDRWSSTRDVPGPRELRDDHFYMDPDWFMANFNRYADVKTYEGVGGDFGIFVGEYAVTRKVGKFGSLRAAIGEAAFMAGMEHNQQTVKLAAYAPLFANVKHQRWSPDMIYVTSDASFVNPSWEVQRLFSENRGKVVLESSVVSESADVGADAPRTFGVGTYKGKAAFKDLKVTDASGKVLWQGDFSNTDAIKDWIKVGGGSWKVVDGTLTQVADVPDGEGMCLSLNRKFDDAIFTLKAKRVAGPEGFLVLYGKGDSVGGEWMNFGGWGNKQHGLEGSVGTRRVDGSIRQDRWYEVKLDCTGGRIRAYLDGQLVADGSKGDFPALTANAVRSEDGKDLIVKVVNSSMAPVQATVVLKNAAVADTAKATVFTGNDPSASNSPDEPQNLKPYETTAQVKNGAIEREFPALSFTIFRIPLR